MSSKSYGAKNANKEKNAEAIADLKNQIKSNRLGRAFLFFGDEPYLIDHYVNEIKKAVLADDTTGMNLIVFDGRLDISDLFDACDTFPVFSDKKLVIVKSSGLFVTKNKKEAGSENTDGEDSEDNPGEEKAPEGNKSQEALKNYLPDLPETTCLLFVETQVDRRLGLFKQFSKSGLAVEFSRQKANELVNWVTKGFQIYGKSISADAAQYLVAISDPDMYTLKNEINKLESYTGDRRNITIEDVRLMATPTIKSVIFDLMDAVIQRNAAKALKLLDDMLQIKEPEQKILAMISKQTGEMLKLKKLLRNGVSPSDLTRYFQGKHPYALKMLQIQADRIDENYLKAILKGCMEADSSYKKGRVSPRLSIEIMLGKLNS